VRAAAEALWANFITCLREGASCDPASFTDHYTGVALSNRTASIQQTNADGISLKNLDQYRIRIMSVTFFGETSAVVRVCNQDHSIQYRAGASPDGSDLVVNDDRSSSILDWEMTKGEDGRWRQQFSDTIDRSVNAEPVCDIDG